MAVWVNVFDYYYCYFAHLKGFLTSEATYPHNFEKHSIAIKNSSILKVLETKPFNLMSE